MTYFYKKTIIFLLVVLPVVFIGLPLHFLYAQTSSSTPADNLRCWTEKACEGDGSQRGVKQGRWDNESRAAVKECPGYGYCFPISNDIPLAIAIPGSQGSEQLVTQVKDLGHYISVIYNFLLGFVV